MDPRTTHVAVDDERSLIGLGEGENFVASDVSAIVSSTRRVIFLEEGDTAELTREAVEFNTPTVQDAR